MDLALSPFELLTTTRAVRKRLDLTSPVAREDVEECLRIGWQAPNAANQQRYNWLVVDDADVRASMAQIYREALELGYRLREEGGTKAYAVEDRSSQINDSVAYLRDHMHEVPVLVVPTINGRMENTTICHQANQWGSTLPATWNFMLALRSKGMGSAWTTVHLHKEREMAELLGIPYEDETQVGLFPVAYTIGVDFKPASRAHSDQTIRWNHW
jgi:nitroreductase